MDQRSNPGRTEENTDYSSKLIQVFYLLFVLVANSMILKCSLKIQNISLKREGERWRCDPP